MIVDDKKGRILAKISQLLNDESKWQINSTDGKYSFIGIESLDYGIRLFTYVSFSSERWIWQSTIDSFRYRRNDYENFVIEDIKNEQEAIRFSVTEINKKEYFDLVNKTLDLREKFYKQKQNKEELRKESSQNVFMNRILSITE